MNYRWFVGRLHHYGFGKTWKRWLQRGDRPNPDGLPRRQPRFQTDEEVQRYVDNQLTNGLPSNWSYRRGRRSLKWHIEPRVRTDKVAGFVVYILEVSSDYRLFVLYYGNTDAGCCFHRLSTAMVMPSEYLSEYSLIKAVTHVIDHCKLNRWGLT